MENREAPARAALRERLAELTPRQRELLASRVAGRSASVSAHPVSTAQFGIWLYERLRPGTPSYHNPAALRVRGRLDPDALQLALREVGARHAPLRSRYEEDDDGNVQALVDPPDTEPVRLRVIDLPPGPEAAAEAERVAREEYLTPFDLEHGPVWRASLIRYAADESLLVVILHHIVSDGSSLGILLAELSAAYTAALAGRPPGLPRPAGSFFRLVERREHGPDHTGVEASLAFWRDRLAGVPDSVPLDHLATAPAEAASAGRTTGFHLDEDLTRRFARVCRANAASLFAGTAALFGVLLSLESGQRQIPLVSPVDTRGAGGAELIGCFINNVVLCCAVEPDTTLTGVLADTGRVVVEALAHHQAPFGRVIAEVAASRSNAVRPFGNVAVVHNNAPAGTGTLPGATLSRHEIPVATVRYDLALHVSWSDSGLRGDLEYAERFPDPVARDLLDRLTALIRLTAEDGSIPVREAGTRLGEPA